MLVLLTMSLLAGAPADATPREAPARDEAAATVAHNVSAYWGDEPVYADATGDALQICCVVSACTFQAIAECDLLSPGGKVVALGGAASGGIGGLIAGLGLATVTYASVTQTTNLDQALGFAITNDHLLAGVILTGAAGIAAGALVGGFAGVAADLLFLRFVDPFSPFAPRYARPTRTPYLDPPIQQTPEGDPPPPLY